MFYNNKKWLCIFAYKTSDANLVRKFSTYIFYDGENLTFNPEVSNELTEPDLLSKYTFYVIHMYYIFHKRDFKLEKQ